MKAVKPKRVKNTEPFDFRMRELLDRKLSDPARYERTTPEVEKFLVEVYERKMKGK